MKLGIGCVYFYGPDGGWILDLHLKYIASTLAGYDYRVYAGANRLQPELRERLKATPRVEVVDLPWYAGRANREHAYYLDLLLQRAAEDGCTHIAALDADSFPVLPNWPNALLRHMGSSIRFAAVLRAENCDTYLPHPCGYLMHRSFLIERRPQLYPDEQVLSTQAFRKFLSQTGQRVDTGIGFAYLLWENGEPWLQLRRSNAYDPHYLMAGVYGGVFFHLGASSRRPAFHRDYVTRPSLRVALRIRSLPLLWRASLYIENRYMNDNARTFSQIARALRTDPDRFLSGLALPSHYPTCVTVAGQHSQQPVPDPSTSVTTK